MCYMGISQLVSNEERKQCNTFAFSRFNLITIPVGWTIIN